MTNGGLHIFKPAEQTQMFLKFGYHDAVMPAIRRCYDTRFIPFYFKHIGTGAVPDNPPPMSLHLVPITITGNIVKEGEQIEINDAFLEITETNAIYFNPTFAIPMKGRGGMYLFKIKADDDVYKSEPFILCLSDLQVTGDFNDDFNNDFNNDFFIGT